MSEWIKISGANVEYTELAGGNFLARFCSTATVLKAKKVFVVAGNGQGKEDALRNLLYKIRGCTVRTPRGLYNTPWIPETGGKHEQGNRNG